MVYSKSFPIMINRYRMIGLKFSTTLKLKLMIVFVRLRLWCNDEKNLCQNPFSSIEAQLISGTRRAQGYKIYTTAYKMD